MCKTTSTEDEKNNDFDGDALPLKDCKELLKSSDLSITYPSQWCKYYSKEEQDEAHRISTELANKLKKNEDLEVKPPED